MNSLCCSKWIQPWSKWPDNAPLAPKVAGVCVMWCQATWWSPDIASTARRPAVPLPRWAVPTCPLSDAAWQGFERCWHPRRDPSQVGPTKTQDNAFINHAFTKIQYMGGFCWFLSSPLNKSRLSTNKGSTSDKSFFLLHFNPALG